MSSAVNLRGFLASYLAEVDEHLQLANARLLGIEKCARDGKADPRSVRDLFRAIHTIKGLSAMVGIEPAVAIAHRMEAALRLADQDGGRLHLESVDTLLGAIREIEHRMRELSGGKDASPAPASLLAALDNLELPAPSGLTGREATIALDLEPAIAAKLAPFERELLVDGARKGRRALRADFSPSPAKAARGLSINTVRERLGSITEIIKVVPVSVPATEEAPGALSFALLVLTSASDDEVAEAVGVAPESLRVIALSSAPDEARTPLPAVLDDDEVGGVIHRRNVVRVDVGRLDAAMDHLSSLIVTRSRLARAIGELTAAGVNTRELSEVLRDSTRQLRDLRAAILRVRMVPVAEMLDRIPLLVRGICRENGIQARLMLEAGHAELDKGVADRLFPAIVHLVRNALDHAIEAPGERVRLGKSEEGVLRIACVAQSNRHLDLTVTDDGRGVDRASVGRRAGRSIDSDAALLDALCRAGLSTRKEATTTSGRGMGMDIVKRIVVEQLGGELSMKTEAGQGTTFLLRVPLTISIVDAFTMICRDQRFVVPVSMVDEILEVDPAKVSYGPAPWSASASSASSSERTLRTGLLERRGETVPLIDLASLFRLKELAGGSGPPRQAMLVRQAGELIAFGLDKVIGQQEAVVRPLLDPLVQTPGVAGSTDLGDGKPTLVLDSVALRATLPALNRAHERGYPS